MFCGLCTYVGGGRCSWSATRVVLITGKYELDRYVLNPRRTCQLPGCSVIRSLCMRAIFGQGQTYKCALDILHIFDKFDMQARYHIYSMSQTKLGDVPTRLIE